ncbi:MAG: hypothetical protein RLZ81_632, partial [Pseudomonadota bacterium]
MSTGRWKRLHRGAARVLLGSLGVCCAPLLAAELVVAQI